MSKERIMAHILLLIVLVTMIDGLLSCTRLTEPTQTVQNVYIKEDDNSSDNNAETEMIVELGNKAEKEVVVFSVPNKLFNILEIEKKEKYTKSTEEKVKDVLNVLVKEYNINIKKLPLVKSVAGYEKILGVVELFILFFFCIKGFFATINKILEEFSK